MADSLESSFKAVAAEESPCKSCGSGARLYGVVDFNKACNRDSPTAFEPSGIPIYYYRCPKCGLLFTTAFDHFGPEEFQRYIYNADYVRVDPDFLKLRPTLAANFIARSF